VAAEVDAYLWLRDYFSEREVHLHQIEGIVHSSRSAFQKIEIFDTGSHGRALVLDGEIQSFEGDEFVYHEALVQPAMVLHPHPERVLVCGGGEGATLREVLRHPTVAEAVMVEIDPAMIEAARQHLPSFHRGAFDDPRSRVVVAEGRSYLTEHEEPFDVVIMDITNPRDGGLSWQLFTREFYALAARRLAAGGTVVIQGDVARVGGLATFPRLIRTLEATFETVHPYVTCITSYAADWGFALANAPEDPLALSAAAIDRRLAERGIEDLGFYDGVTHERIFRLPKYLRRSIEQEKAISTDTAPIRETYPGVT
jgi:spermidine synthase